MSYEIGEIAALISNPHTITQQSIDAMDTWACKMGLEFIKHELSNGTINETLLLILKLRLNHHLTILNSTN